MKHLHNACKTLLIAIVFFSAFHAHGQVVTVGPRFPDTVKSVMSAPSGNVPWTNPNSARLSDNAYATITMPASFFNAHLLCSSRYGFSIPSGAAILSIDAHVEKYGYPFSNVQDKDVYFSRNGIIATGTNMAKSGLWPTRDSVMNYTQSGIGWTAAEINSSTFGLFLSMSSFMTNAVGYVDAVSISVSYTLFKPRIITQPAAANACTGTNKNINITAEGAQSYQWQTDSATGTFTNIANNSTYSNVNMAQLSIANVSAVHNGYKFRCILTNTIGTTTSDSAVLSVVTGSPVAGADPADVIACPGTTASFTASATSPGSNHTYQWQVNSGSGFTDLSNSSAYANVTTPTLTINSTRDTTYHYTYRMRTDNGCGSVYSNSAKLLLPTPTGTRDFTGSGNWNDPANWTPCGLPGAADAVIIGTGDSIVIPAGYQAIAKSVSVTGGVLRVETTGALQINNASAAGIQAQSGARIFNDGTITINNTYANGIDISNAVWNNTGSVEINNVGTNGISTDNTASVINSGSITIGNRGPIQHRGLNCVGGSTITNNGVIYADSVIAHNGLEIQGNAVFTNNGSLYTGTTASLGEDGLYMYQGTFINNGQFTIRNTRRNGLQALASSLVNKGLIDIKNTQSIAFTSSLNASVINDTTGILVISKVPDLGLNNEARFTNRGLIRLGADDFVRDGILHRSGNFSNEASGIIEIDSVSEYASLRSFDPFINAGILRFGSRSAAGSVAITVENGSSFINTGLVDVKKTTNGGILIVENTTFKNEDSGIIKVSVIPNGSAIDNFGTFSNTGIIRAGAAGPLRFNGVYNGPNGDFSNIAPGLIEIDSISNIAIETVGQMVNTGDIYAGTRAAIGNHGIYVLDSLFLNKGRISIRNAQNSGVTVVAGARFVNDTTGSIHAEKMTTGFFNRGAFINRGLLKAGGGDLIATFGLINATSGTFINTTSGIIQADSIAGSCGICNDNQFTNEGKIHIGSTASVRTNYGIYNNAATLFHNTATGSIEVNDLPLNEAFGITAIGEFLNQGDIKVGNTKPIYAIGILYNGDNSQFINDTAGKIEINNITQRDALQLNSAVARFINRGLMRVGNLGSVNRTGIYLAVGSAFVNAATGILELDHVTNPAGAFGAVTVRPGGSFSNNGTLKIGLNTACRAAFCSSGGNGELANSGNMMLGNFSGETIDAFTTVHNNNGGNIMTVSGGKLEIAGKLVNNTGAVVTNNITGTITVDSVLINDGTITNNGILKGHGAITQNGTFTNTNGAHIAPGNSPGTLTVHGDFDLGGATLDVEVNGPTPSLEYDVLRITGNANVSDAQVNMILGNGYIPMNSDVITFIDAAGITGNFGGSLPGGINIRYNFPTVGDASVGNSTALPVKLLSFEARRVSGLRNRISFSSAVESEAVQYEVTRSSNGADFKTIGTVTGNGNGSSYTFYDEQPIEGANFYRLKMTEQSGAVSYSHVAIVKNGRDNEGTVIIAPVPASVTITISGTDPSLDGTGAIVTDLYGKEVHRFVIGSTNRINVSNWPAGNYILRLSNGKSMKLVKQ